MSSSPKPIVVFVPGAWHSPDAFTEVMTTLHAAGYETKGVALPSVTATDPIEDIGPDVAAIREIVQLFLDEGKNVLLFMHSYGGLIGSEAVQGLDCASRQKQGKKGGIAHVIYCCAYALQEGVSLFDLMNGEPLSWFQMSTDAKLVDVTPADAEHYFYNGVAEPARWVTKLKPHSWGTFKSKTTYSAHKHVPSTYLVCEKDNALPLAAQKSFLASEGASFRVETFDTGHSPFLTMPKEVTIAIRKVAGETC